MLYYSKEIESIMWGNKNNIINDEHAEAVITHLFDLAIHNDCQGTTID